MTSLSPESFNNKRVIIMGLGRFGGGTDAAKFSVARNAKVLVTDLARKENLTSAIEQLENIPEIEFRLGQHKTEDFKNADIVIANPAVPRDNKYLEIARKNNALVTYQINIFFQLCPAKIIGITGSNGKSTTTALTAHLLKSASHNPATPYRNVWLSGNIGNNPLLQTLDKIKPRDLVVLELSSFQLEQLAEIKTAPQISLITNLTANHLDRHGTFKNYCAAKENIFANQNLNPHDPAISIFNAHDPVAQKWHQKYNTQPAGRACLKYSPNDVPEKIQKNFKLPGRANFSNLAGAIKIARQFNLNNTTIAQSVSSFQPLPHRLQFIAQKRNVRWYNDSISTTPESSIAALQAFDQPKIIIAGGYDKNLPFSKLGQTIARQTKAAILIGKTARKIENAIRQADSNNTQIILADSLEQATIKADRLANPGDVVLLSPACASYDMFDNFQQRGQLFTKLVNQIST